MVTRITRNLVSHNGRAKSRHFNLLNTVQRAEDVDRAQGDCQSENDNVQLSSPDDCDSIRVPITDIGDSGRNED